MSRSGYTEDYDDQWALIRWRGAVKAAMRGTRGQNFLREMVASLDALPVKSLTTHELQGQDGSVCALGAVARERGLDVSSIDPENIEEVAAAFGISDAMTREIVWMNDEANWHRESPEARWRRMREWALSWIKQDETA